MPLEVALMKMVSAPPKCDNIVELLEWFERPDCLILVMERPSPCMNLHHFSKLYNGQVPEPLARDIMRQVIQAAIHCSDRKVLHRDIKPENLLINPETLQVKLIDFGCGDLLKDSAYTSFAGKTYSTE
ncbi:MAG: protein kinase domain-containing protein [Cetobacterium sp.]